MHDRRKMRTVVNRWRWFGVTAFAVIMLLGGIVGLAFFARPTVSAAENRNLTQFPEMTPERFLNGSYFTDLSLWYADTYPLREPMVSANLGMARLYGLPQESGMVGGNVAADEVPVEETGATAVEAPTEAPDERAVAEDIQNNIMEGVYIENGVGYSVLYFDQVGADTYIAALNKAAEQLDGVSTVYSVLAPASVLMLGGDAAKVGGTDQQQVFDYIRTRLDSRAVAVEPYKTMTQHTDEYLFFYTDHHWTQRGAYYAYEELCKKKGIDAIPLEDREYKNMGVLTGTYYDTVSSMGTPREDTVEAFFPIDTNVMTITSATGEEYENPIVDPSVVDWDSSARYSTFIAGDQPLEIIHNPQITDGSSCLVVKDSYGCAFCPLLVDHYENLYIIDFRYTDKNIVDFAKEHEIQDVVFMTGAKIALAQSAAETILSEVS